jgi:hypothetical protein
MQVVIKPATKSIQVVATKASKEEIASMKKASPKQNLVQESKKKQPEQP